MIAEYDVQWRRANSQAFSAGRQDSVSDHDEDLHVEPA